MELSNYAKIFKALSNEQRLKIFMMIYNQCKSAEETSGTAAFNVNEKEACCPGFRTLEKAFTKACDCMNLSRSTISHHFKELQNAGLINCEREGQTFRCSINEEVVESIRDFIK